MLENGPSLDRRPELPYSVREFRQVNSGPFHSTDHDGSSSQVTPISCNWYSDGILPHLFRNEV